MACLGASKRTRFYPQNVVLPATMTQHPSRPPPYLQPRPKAAPTLSDTSGISKAKSATPPYLSRPSSQSRPSSPTPPRAVNFDASTKATRALIRRVFYPDTRAGSKDSCSLDELLPPLTSSNEIDLQLYAIIAIVIKDTVHSWYGKITLDESFVEEVIQIVAHCTRAIEGRLRSVDLEGLVFDELPQLVDDHIRGSYYDPLRLVDLLLIESQHFALPIRCLPQLNSAQTLESSIMTSILIRRSRPYQRHLSRQPSRSSPSTRHNTGSCWSRVH